MVGNEIGSTVLVMGPLCLRPSVVKILRDLRVVARKNYPKRSGCLATASTTRRMKNSWRAQRRCEKFPVCPISPREERDVLPMSVTGVPLMRVSAISLKRSRCPEERLLTIPDRPACCLVNTAIRWILFFSSNQSDDRSPDRRPAYGRTSRCYPRT